MNVPFNISFSIFASLTMLLVATESNAQSGSRHATSYGSSMRSPSFPIQSPVNYAPPQRVMQPNQPITNVYRSARPMPLSNHNGYPSTNGYISQPASYVPRSSCDSTIALRVPRSDFRPAPTFQNQSSSQNYLPSPQHIATPKYAAPVSNTFSPTVIRPGCANGKCRK